MTAQKPRSSPSTPAPQWQVVRGIAGAASDEQPNVLVIGENIGFLAAMTTRLIEREVNSRLTHHGLTAGQLPVLAQLWAEDGLIQRDLCQRIVVEAATTTKTLNRMASEGLLERRADPFDRRQQRIFLTPKGLELRDKLAPEVVAINSLLLQGLSSRQANELRRLLTRVVTNLGGNARQPQLKSP